ncbi:MAG: all-trans-8'-apo-beta-carotenal 15,15'-oxygenase [Myxococcota bacterium]|jgi:all-trans-8'-apo-beta-carotenal 15,15'-oxygenase
MRPPIPAPTAYFSNLSREHDFEPVEVEGTLPPGLSGTLYRNGPGIMEQFGRRYDHLFEGDGAITAVRFADGAASVSSRVVQSAGLIEERAAGRHLGSFAASWPQRLRRVHGGGMKNTANTNLMAWQGRLYALMEGAKPTSIDPDTLATLGETDLGAIPGSFSAHPHTVAARRCLYNFGLSYGKQTTLDLFALPDDGAARMISQIPLPSAVMLHDFAATERHLIFFIAPLQLVLWRVMLAVRPFQDNFRWNAAAGTEVIVVPLDSPDKPIRFHTDAFMQFHFAGAFEDRGEIAVDYVRYDDGELLFALGDGMGLSMTDAGSRAPGGRLHRARIDLAGKRLTSEPLWDGDCEFPRTNPVRDGRYTQTWLLCETIIGGEVHFQIGRLDADGSIRHHTLPRGALAGEPVLAGDGSVMTLVYDCFTQRSHLLLLDSETLEPQARVRLSQAIPLTFHGGWVSR